MATMDAVLDYVGYGSNIPQPLGGAAHGNGTHRIPRCQVPGISSPKRNLEEADFKMRVRCYSLHPAPLTFICKNKDDGHLLFLLCYSHCVCNRVCLALPNKWRCLSRTPDVVAVL
jgi:hypothetical protein